ncbi:MAG TPA: dihydropteroate synthase, partial [Vicinamibacterales bacterium]|nr:dihydropteroate synthase [Vicinamibacterales bacterium]
AIAERAIERVASIVNDVSALACDPDLAGVVARHGAAVILMHTRGRSADMYAHATYADVIGEVATELGARVRAAGAAGIDRDRIVVDPGLGFAKTADQSWQALAGLGRLHALGLPVLSGPSRKSFLKAALGDVPPDDRIWGTAAAVTASVLAGAHIVRVHDVRAMVDVVRCADQLLASGAGFGPES